jgi:CHAT domain-containing protein/Flp pilus assembly protein TadD
MASFCEDQAEHFPTNWLTRRKLSLTLTLARKARAIRGGEAQSMGRAMEPVSLDSQTLARCGFRRIFLPKIDSLSKHLLLPHTRKARAPFFLILVLFAGTLLLVKQATGWVGQAARTEVAKTGTAERAFSEGKALSAEWKVDSLRRAVKQFEIARFHWRAIGNRRGEIDALQNMAETYDHLSDFQKALEYQKQALRLSGAARERTQEIKSLNSIGSLCLSLGKKEEALAHSQQALRLSHTLRYSFGEALALSNLGEIAYARGDLRRSLEFFEQAMRLLEGEGHDAEQAQVLLNAGYAYADSGDMRKALDVFTRALSLAQTALDLRGQARASTVTGQVYSYLGEKQKALEFHQQALEIFQSMGNRDGEAVTHNGIGFVYESLGEYQAAIENYNSAFELFQSVRNLEGEAFTIYYVGKMQVKLGNEQKGLKDFARGLSLIRSLGDRRGEAHMLKDVGVVYFHLGNYSKALRYYGRALSLVRSSGDLREEGYVLNDMGHVYEVSGAKNTAKQYYGQALPLGQTTDDRGLEAVVLHNIAHLDRERGDLVAALGNIEAAIKITEGTRTSLSSLELRSSYLASNHDNYELYIDLLMQMHKHHPSSGWDGRALQASEKARARSLIDMLAEGQVDIREGVEPGLLERERWLQRSLDAKAERQTQLLSGRHRVGKESAALAKEIRELTIDYEQVRAQIRSKSPRYALLTQPAPLSLEEIQRQVLNRETLLLEYALGDERSYLWAVSPTALTTYELPKRGEIEKQARRVHDLLVARQTTAEKTDGERHIPVLEADIQYWRHATSLSQTLLGPVAGLLGTKRLVIITEGSLQYLPFGALPVPKIEDERSNLDSESLNGPSIGQHGNVNTMTDRPLVLEHEIVSLPSASVLAELRRETGERETPPKAVFVLADPVFEEDDPRVRSASNQKAVTEPIVESILNQRGVIQDLGLLRNSLNVRRLPSTRLEAEAIMAVAPPGEAKIAMGFDASRATATSPELGQYRIVHFATHGIVNNEHPELSGIILSMVDERGHPQNGFLRLHDIYNLTLQVDLVVLSACDTGLGKQIEGEGLVGMVRGFLHAGAARVVASLWKVDDEATAELMKQFYQQMLQAGVTPAAALREAQISMWQQRRWQSPYYWGAFVLQGEWR